MARRVGTRPSSPCVGTSKQRRPNVILSEAEGSGETRHLRPGEAPDASLRSAWRYANPSVAFPGIAASADVIPTASPPSKTPTCVFESALDATWRTLLALNGGTAELVRPGSFDMLRTNGQRGKFDQTDWRQIRSNSGRMAPINARLRRLPLLRRAVVSRSFSGRRTPMRPRAGWPVRSSCMFRRSRRPVAPTGTP